MRAAYGQFKNHVPEYLELAKQFGITDMLLNMPLLWPGDSAIWQLYSLVDTRRNVESYDLKLSALENVPKNFYGDIMLNGPKRDEQMDNMITTVRNIARAGIPIFVYNWMPWRTWPVDDEFGQPKNYREADEMPLAHVREYTEEEMWENLEYWIKIITPVAEEEGIRLGIHSCEPPATKIGGAPQLFNSYDNYRRYLDIYPSNNCAIVFCQGAISEMFDSTGDALYEFIAEMVQKENLLDVHFRNLTTPNPEDFPQEFINTGQVDMYRAMKTYYDNGYDSFFIDDQMPRTLLDIQWGHSRAFAIGYIQAMIEAVTKGA